MKLYISNLGAIHKAELEISDVTIITGPNGTGKSFVTKLLYSIFSSIESFSVWSITRNLMIDFVSFATDISSNDAFNETKETINDLLNDDFSIYSKPIDYITEKQILKKNSVIFEKLCLDLIDTFNGDVDEHGILITESLEGITKKERFLITVVSQIAVITTNDDIAYQYYWSKNLNNEVKENFQIQSLDEIMSNNENSLSIELENIFSIYKNRGDDRFYVTSKNNTIDFFRSKPNSIFFESPVYWRIRDALLNSRSDSDNNYLTGVPKFFFDLDKDLISKTKEPTLYLDIFEEVKNLIGGEFIIDGTNIDFKINNEEKTISKNIVSFGMTNLGMLNALIKNNIF